MEKQDIAVVIGATGGIGAALADAIERGGRFSRVIRLSRSSKPALDLTDEPSIAAAADYLKGQGSVRLVIDATGILHGDKLQPEKALRQLTPEAFATAFAINATGPALLMKHVIPVMARDGKAVFATLSAKVGSIGDNAIGGWHAYRASKAALNQIVRTVSIELKRTRPNIILAALHPGTVDTALSQPFAKDGLNVQPPGRAAGRLLSVIDGLTGDDSGGFFSWDGSALPW